MNPLAEPAFWSVVAAGAVRLATPLLLAALGELVVERAGLINLGIDGMMLLGAWAGVIGAGPLGWPGGLALGSAAGAALGGVMAALTEIASGDLIVVGIGLSLLGAGLSELFLPVAAQATDTAPLALAPTVSLAWLAPVPILGGLVGPQSLLSYLAATLIIGTAALFRFTRVGLATRAVGLDKEAAALRGLSVKAWRSGALVVGGALAGLAGAALTLGYVGSFSAGMTAGRGYIAIAVVIVGRGTLGGMVAAALAFAALESAALQSQSRIANLPVEFFQAVPYAATLVALALSASTRGGFRLRRPMPGGPSDSRHDEGDDP